MNITYNNGVIEVSTVHKGFRVAKTYIGYSEAEAIQLFEAFLLSI